MRVDTPPFPYDLFNSQEKIIGEVAPSHVGNEVAHHPLQSNNLPPKMRCWWEVQCCSAALISGYHV
jgi:hypothetical protein